MKCIDWELRGCSIALVFGFAEMIDEDVFNAVVFIDHSGRICGQYHKMQFAEGYDSAWWFNRLGKTSWTFDTSSLRIVPLHRRLNQGFVTGCNTGIKDANEKQETYQIKMG